MVTVILSFICIVLCIVSVALFFFIKHTLERNSRMYRVCDENKALVEEMMSVNYNNVNSIRDALQKVDKAVGVIVECERKTSDFNKRLGRLERKLKS